MKSNRGPKIDCSGPPTVIISQEEGSPLSTTLFFLLLKMQDSRLSRSGPAKWRATLSGELRFMTSYLES